MQVDQWKIVPTTVGNGTFYVLVDSEGKTKAQGRKALCDAVLASNKFNDDARQRSERFAFYGIVR